MGDGRIFLKKSTAPLSLMTTYLMSLISAGSISLDSTFKKWKYWITAYVNFTEELYYDRSVETLTSVSKMSKLKEITP
jgi:hypothetical protein